jgi:hypothetical protein
MLVAVNCIEKLIFRYTCLARPVLGVECSKLLLTDQHKWWFSFVVLGKEPDCIITQTTQHIRNSDCPAYDHYNSTQLQAYSNEGQLFKRFDNLFAKELYSEPASCKMHRHIAANHKNPRESICILPLSFHLHM